MRGTTTSEHQTDPVTRCHCNSVIALFKEHPPVVILLASCLIHITSQVLIAAEAAHDGAFRQQAAGTKWLTRSLNFCVLHFYFLVWILNTFSLKFKHFKPVLQPIVSFAASSSGSYLWKFCRADHLLPSPYHAIITPALCTDIDTIVYFEHVNRTKTRRGKKKCGACVFDFCSYDARFLLEIRFLILINKGLIIKTYKHQVVMNISMSTLRSKRRRIHEKRMLNMDQDQVHIQHPLTSARRNHLTLDSLTPNCPNWAAPSIFNAVHHTQS